MFTHPEKSPIREVLHWAEQAFFAFVLLAGLGLAFYAVVAPSSTQLSEARDIVRDSRVAELPSFHLKKAS